MHQTGASVLEHGKKQISIHWGKAIDFIILSAWVTVLHNSAFYCREQLRPSCCDYGLSAVDNFPDLSSWVFMLGLPYSSVSLHHSIPTTLLLSPLNNSPLHTHLHYLLLDSPCTFNTIMSPLLCEPQARKKTSFLKRQSQTKTRIAMDSHFRWTK